MKVFVLDTEQAAHDKGFCARRAGIPKNQNPYIVDEKNFADAWDKGWEDGSIERTIGGS